MTSLIGTNADWYLMRASGVVAFVLLTCTAALGVANLARVGRRPSTRTVATLVHRNASLLAVTFLLLHVLTAISDRYVHVPLLAAVVPGVSGYDSLWVGLGAASVDLMAAVVATSLLRARMRHRSWQLVHWLAYLSWPTAFIHAIGSGSGTGTDTGTLWSTAVYGCCAVVFAAAVVLRLGRRPTVGTPRARPAVAGSTVPTRPASLAGAGPAAGRLPELATVGSASTLTPRRSS
ncbi:MAG TPA: ferric reductase-like transmembrane domain-containing protein [Acidimicrobiales bacterium]|nr:ferric reductase-like transmembrane domain-containing protein [Acidimicrobiales bacterium]